MEFCLWVKLAYFLEVKNIVAINKYDSTYLLFKVIKGANPINLFYLKFAFLISLYKQLTSKIKMLFSSHLACFIYIPMLKIQ